MVSLTTIEDVKQMTNVRTGWTRLLSSEALRTSESSASIQRVGVEKIVSTRCASSAEERSNLTAFSAEFLSPAISVFVLLSNEMEAKRSINQVDEESTDSGRHTKSVKQCSNLNYSAKGFWTTHVSLPGT